MHAVHLAMEDWSLDLQQIKKCKGMLINVNECK